MGEAQCTVFEPEFNRSIKVQTTDQRITPHAGAILLREFDHQLGLAESIGEQVIDPRDPDKVRYTATEPLLERIYVLALGSQYFHTSHGRVGQDRTSFVLLYHEKLARRTLRYCQGDSPKSDNLFTGET